jgi:hypothetical protein
MITIKQLKRNARKGRPVYLVQMHHVGTRDSSEGSASLEYAANAEIISTLGIRLRRSDHLRRLSNIC